MRGDELDRIPDARDGLTRIERAVLLALEEVRRERGERAVPTAMLYGRVVSRVSITPEELRAVLARLGARGEGGRP